LNLSKSERHTKGVEHKMSSDKDQTAMRIRRFYRKGGNVKKYGGSYELLDERTQEVLAACDLIGRAVFAQTAITDDKGRTWTMAPNRKIMPSRWLVSDPSGNVEAIFDQKIVGKLLNPLYKTALAICDSQGRETFRVVDPRKNIGDIIFGAGPGQWAVVAGDQPVAKLGRLQRDSQPAKGFFGKLRRFFTGSDQAIISAGSRHILAPAVALGMILIFNELTDGSAE